jgi:photosystem II stability/assembly factor-like uncharacterized protein
MTDPDLETRLRDALRAQARHAPRPDDTVREVLLDLALRSSRRPSRWRTWAVPLVAAGAVATVATALVGVEHMRSSAHRQSPAAPSSAPVPTLTDSAPSPSVAPTSPPSSATYGPSTVAQSVGLRHFSVIDLTFVGPYGWALGSADCTSGAGQGGVCAAMARTTDDGATWHSMVGPPTNVPLKACAEPCVQSVRFATTSVGYVFGHDALFMTTDGGRSWQRLAGGADALESLDGNVVRVSSSCIPGCPPIVQTSAIGSTTWVRRTLPAGAPGFGVRLVRAGSDVYLLTMGHVAGGAQSATSVLFTSADDGATWSARGEPCPQGANDGASNGERDSVAVAAAGDGSAVALCTPRGGTDSSFVAVSTDHGATFHGTAGDLGSIPGGVVAAASARTLLVMGDVLYRSSDGGASWRRVQHDSIGPLTASWFGFESPTQGRVVEGGTIIWTTRDGGLTWSSVRFS